MEVLFNDLKKRYKKISIVCVCVTGSKSWKSENCKDLDLVVIAENTPLGARMHFSKAYNADVWLYSIPHFEKMAKGESLHYSPIVGLAQCNPENVLYGEIPIANYNWFDYQKLALLRTYEQGLRGYFNVETMKQRGKEYCLKSMIWALLAWFAIQNQSFEFTTEQREILQKCHDLQLPVSYAEELKINMESKLKEWGLIK